MDGWVKKVAMLLTVPLRHPVRYELYLRSISKDINAELERRATQSTAEYVSKFMLHADSFETREDLLRMAVGEANLTNGRLACEFGVFDGTSINYVSSLVETRVYGFDSFEGLPERWRDGYGKGFFKFSSLPRVRSNVDLIKGWFKDTLPAFLERHREAVGFLHIDCDLYSSTECIFNLMSDRIGPECIIVFDEYFNYPGWEGGEHKAFKEFVARTGKSYDYIGFNSRGAQAAIRITS